ncbi:MAG: sigma-E factor negative regulatory protein, partial [Rhodanobacteraceae bacterium]
EMDPTSREDLSALMDGELDAESARFLLRRVEHESELARTWSRWHLVRECLTRDGARSMAHPQTDDVFAARVLNALQQRAHTRRRWARFAGGGAIAASVAAAALILAVPQTTTNDSTIAAVSAHSAISVNTKTLAAMPAPRVAAPAPWLAGASPTFLAARPASANAVLAGGGYLQSGYLQTASYAPDAAPMLIRDPNGQGNAPYLILLVPDNSGSKHIAPRRH